MARNMTQAQTNDLYQSDDLDQMMHPANQALFDIEDAELPAPVYRTARRLLDLAAARDGQVIVDRSEMCFLCGNAADGTMRSHLIQLARAGIIQYHTNHMVSVRFLAWLPGINTVIDQRANTRAERAPEVTNDATVIAQRSDTRAERSQPSPPTRARRSDARAERSLPKHRALGDQIRAPSDQIRALSARQTPPLVGCLVVDPTPTGNDLDKQTNNHGPEVSDHWPPPSPVDQAKGFAMLIDPAVGIAPKTARQIAATTPAGEILRQIAAWLPEKQKGKQGPGLLIQRLRDQWGASEPSSEFKNTDFFRRHFPGLSGYRSPEEMEEAEREYHRLMRG